MLQSIKFALKRFQDITKSFVFNTNAIPFSDSLGASWGLEQHNDQFW